MKNSQKGFAPLLLIIIAVVIIAGGTYLYTRHKEVFAPPVNDNQKAASTTQNNLNSNNSSSNVQATTSVKGVSTNAKIPPTTLSEIDLKYKIKKYFNNRITFCGPPVIYSSYRDDQLALFSTIQANVQEYQAILKNLNLTGVTNFTDEQKLEVVGEHNQLSAITLTSVGINYTFTTGTFTERVGYSPDMKIVEGTITKSGIVTVTKSTPSVGGCPV